MATDLRSLIVETANSIGISPVDLATAISYETGGTFDPTKRGPTTKWGQHRGLIQFGEPQARKYGVDWNDPIGSQLGEGKAVARYLTDAGVRPGMGMLDVYSAINAGGVGPQYHGRSDTAAGGAPGTVADKVNSQMAGHRQKAESLLGDAYAGMADGPKGQEMYKPVFGSMSPGAPQNNSIDPNVAAFAFGDDKPGWGDRLQNAGKHFDAAMSEIKPPRIAPMGGAGDTGNALSKVMNNPTVADMLMKRRAPFLFG